MPSSSSSHSVLPSHFTTLIPTTCTINYQPEGSMGPQPEPTTAKSQSNGYTKKEKAAVRYGECRKNHAAGIGGYAVDGCREFMASGEEGTPAALRCAACACHRSFHKREVHGEPALLWDCSSNSNFTSSSSSRR